MKGQLRPAEQDTAGYCFWDFFQTLVVYKLWKVKEKPFHHGAIPLLRFSEEPFVHAAFQYFPRWFLTALAVYMKPQKYNAMGKYFQQWQRSLAEDSKGFFTAP